MVRDWQGEVESVERDLDVYAANSGFDKIWINDGGLGIFVDSGQDFDFTFSTAITLGDVDGDGDLDLLLPTGE